MDISIHNPPKTDTYRLFQERYHATDYAGTALNMNSKGQNGGIVDFDIPSTGPKPCFIADAGLRKRFVKITSK